MKTLTPGQLTLFVLEGMKVMRDLDPMIGEEESGSGGRFSSQVRNRISKARNEARIRGLM